MKKAVMGLVAAVTAGAAAADAAVIEMTVGEKSYAVELLENDAARDLMRRLPLEVTFENFGTVERIAYLKKALNLGSAPRETTPAAGVHPVGKPCGVYGAFPALPGFGAARKTL